jgi:hypothetical protein
MAAIGPDVVGMAPNSNDLDMSCEKLRELDRAIQVLKREMDVISESPRKQNASPMMGTCGRAELEELAAS